MNSDGSRTFGRYQTLLLATDGSEYSEGAIREALSLAQRCSAKLHLASVVIGNDEYDALVPELVEKREREARAHLEAVRERAAQQETACELHVVHGPDPSAELASVAAEAGADMLIMGRRGKTGLMKLMMGSVTARAIGAAPCNVLVVPRAAAVTGKRLLVATDGSSFAEAAVQEAAAMAKRCDGQLVAVYATNPNEMSSAAGKQHAEEVLASARRYADAAGVAMESLVEEGRPHEVITAIAGRIQVDLTVVGTHGRTALQKFLMGSVAERVIGHAEGAVLVVKSS